MEEEHSSCQECAMSEESVGVTEPDISTLSVEDLKSEMKSLQAQLTALKDFKDKRSLSTISKLNAELTNMRRE
eukprot:7432645-Karenia_brevis.AAC.1